MSDPRIIDCEEALRHPEVRRSYWQIETPVEGVAAS